MISKTSKVKILSIPILSEAKQVLATEAQCILAAKDRLDKNFESAINLIVDSVTSGGKIIVCGVGKSGKIAAKVAATLASTGTPALFLHPTEASHGDLGVVSPKDILLAFSYSGTSHELLSILPSLCGPNGRGNKIISIVGNTKSPLALQSDVVLDGSVSKEACPLNLAPTSSTTVALALGDAISVVLSLCFEFKEETFANNHPGGALGRRLNLKIQDLMKSGEDLPWVDSNANMQDVVEIATQKKLGAVLVRDAARKKGDRNWIGLITDGDIRRALKHRDRFFDMKACDIMTENPVSVGIHEKAIRALELMENRASQINVLPVVDEKGECIGIVRLHDLIGKL